MEKHSKHASFEENHPKLAFALPKVVSLCIVASLIFSLYANKMAIAAKEAGNMSERFSWEGWGNAGIVFAAVLAVALVSYYRGMYSVFWSKAAEANLDERQKALRNRIFLRSYRWLIVLLWLFLFGILQDASQREQIYATWITMILVAALPSILASFHKNAR